VHWETETLVDGELGEVDNADDYLLDLDGTYDDGPDTSRDSLATAAPKNSRRRLTVSNSGDDSDVTHVVSGREYLRVEDVNRHAQGAHASRRRNVLPDTLSASEKADILNNLPKDYDPRRISFPIPTPPMITVPTDQGGCGSCWAFGGTTALSWRLYLKSRGKYNVVPSQQVAMTCGSGKCSVGGYAGMVFDTANKGYLPAATMAPYTLQVVDADKVFCANPNPSEDALARIAESISYRTRTTDPDIGTPDKYVATTTIVGFEAVMKEVYENGPVAMYIQWVSKSNLLHSYPANPSVCNGIQTDRQCSHSAQPDARKDDGITCVFPRIDHVVVVIGWGEDEIGCPERGLPGPIKYATIRVTFMRAIVCRSACWAVLLVQGGHLRVARCQVLDNPEFARRCDRRLRRHWVWILQDRAGRECVRSGGRCRPSLPLDRSRPRQYGMQRRDGPVLVLPERRVIRSKLRLLLP
jgi:hypothetical protein